ncbi:AAA family ATPase [Roseomonas haemaphysalidis]|uniref:AAA family ATPase n=1 Tax=Roseomonas haemaphysalidis TaxID=2768162 RepID=A0ABS3KRI7_9PROT|nr:AAA family ATPase [Roseomonas haemaphysalidis]MBO1080069.1 AAA family ATPase [Roseomonas haemaphysalidis]
MRLTGLTLRRYGPFQDAALRFDPAPGRINLVLAPNGAGKSVLRHAFSELLFGIAGQTPMGFRHGYSGMQLSATGLAADGTAFAVTRRKGLRNTLTGADDVALDAAWMDRLLGRADARLLQQLFALDTDRLRQGGRDLLSSGGALADALLAAAGGLREASALRRELEEERDRLAPPRRVAARPFHAALDRWTDSRRALRQSLVRPQEWAGREQALRDAALARDASGQAAAEAATALRRLERIRRTRPQLLRHAAAAGWLAAHPQAPHLPPGLAARLPAARGAVALAAHGVGTLQGALHRLDADIAAISTDDALLAHAGAIAALTRETGLVEQADAALPEVEAALAAAQARVAAALAALGQPPGAAEPDAPLPSAALRGELRRLLAEHTAGQDTRARLPRRLAEGAARLRHAEAALAALPPSADAPRLDELLAAIRRDGDPAAALAAARRGVAEAEARLASLVATLPAPLRDPAVLAALDPHPAPNRLADARDAAGAALARAEDMLARAAEALQSLRQQRSALLAAGVPPTREALAAARARRDSGWALLFRRLTGEPDGAGEAAHAGGQPLPLAYAEAVATADRLADARWSEAERAATAERLARDLPSQEAAHAAALDGHAAAARALDAAQQHWDAALRPLGLAAGSGLAEAQRVLATRDAALAAAEALARLRAGLDELQARQETAAARLAQALGEATAALPLLLDRAEERLRDLRLADNRRQSCEAALAAARDAQREATGEQAEATDRHARWQRAWDAALARLGLAPGLPPDALEERLRLCDALGDALREVAALQSQAAGWQAAVARFRAGYDDLCRALGLAPDAVPLAGLRALDRRQRGEAALAERRAALRDGRARDATALRDAETALAGAEAALQTVLAEAGADTPEQAEARIALGTERARQEASRAVAEDALLAGGDGLGLDALRAEAGEAPDDLEPALAEAEATRARHAADAERGVALVARLELEMQQLAGDDAALRAAAEEAAAAGMLGQTLDDALLLQVAAGLLDAALATVQDGADDRLLRRIGDAFAMLTDGGYTGVSSQPDERGTARLVLRSRAFPDEECGVDGLSEGTRDALFLALRLVAIEDQAASGTVLPFLGDDILQSFDDHRAAAAFRALLALSQTAQVILLSHHEHLLPVLRAAVPDTAVHVQRLDG